MNDSQNNSFENAESGGSGRRPFSRFGKPPANLAELPDKLLALLRQSPAGEIEQNLKNFINGTIAKLDLVTREEFEIQQAMIEKLRVRIEKIEARLDRDEQQP